MDFSKLSTNNMIAGGGGVLALISLFLPWYSVDFGFGAGSVSANAFDAGFFAWAGCLLALAGGVIVALKAMDVTDVKVGGLAAEQFAMILAGLGVVFVILKLLVDSSFVSWGLFVGLIAAGAAAAGAFLSGKDVGIGLPSADDFSGGGGGDSTGGGTSTF